MSTPVGPTDGPRGPQGPQDGSKKMSGEVRAMAERVNEAAVFMTAIPKAPQRKATNEAPASAAVKADISAVVRNITEATKKAPPIDSARISR